MNRGFWKLILIAALVLPTPALAQCGMMSGGGHQHGSTGTHDHGSTNGGKQASSSHTKLDPKASKAANKLLDDPKGREALLATILNDRDFVELLVEQFVADPQWRELMATNLNATPPSATREATGGATDEVQAEYQCPMHPEVRSDKPGTCPKCGMTLERVRVEGQP